MKKMLVYLLILVLCYYGGTMKTLPVRAHGKDKIILQLPEHLDQIYNIVSYAWNKNNVHIATVHGNGALRVPDPKYKGILSSSHDGSLIIKGSKSWNVGDEYSVDIIMTDSNISTIRYRVNGYIQRDTGPTFVHATVGENLILPVEYVLMEQIDIQAIDWLTERWVYFAITNVNGTIDILEHINDGSLSSAPNGSLMLAKVAKRDEGIYRACIFSRKGFILEQMYQVYISEDYDGKTKWNQFHSLSENKMIILFCLLLHTVIMISCILYQIIKRIKEQTKTILDPKVYTKIKKSHSKPPIWNFSFIFRNTEMGKPPRWYPYFDAVEGLARSKFPESFIGNFKAISGADQDKKGYYSGGGDLC